MSGLWLNLRYQALSGPRRPDIRMSKGFGPVSRREPGNRPGKAMSGFN
jgi:hypothetical protein